jgi:ATP-binding cassette subfamily F protein 3
MQRITEYPGNYSNYLVAKAERSEMQQRQFDNQQQFIKQQEAFINRFKAKASKATAAQSRVKMLEKIERVEAPEDDNREINIQFRIAQQSGRVVADLQQVTKSFPGVPIVKNAERMVHRGDKIALIGANGKGKSTVLRMINGSEPFEGQIIRGHNLRESFYAQHQLESLNLDNEILDELRLYAGQRTDNELRTLLGCFLFAGDEVFKKIKVLSGGEKARVALAKTLMEEANFLLLDEPTNHLDIRSINILIQSLQQYEGTFLVVSHDRYFVSNIANKIWWIENEELKEYPGTYAEYEYWRKKQEEEKLKAGSNKQEKPKVVEPKKVEEKKTDAKKVSNNHIQNLNKKFETIEKDIAALKSTLLQQELDFGNPVISGSIQKLEDLRKNYEANKQQLGALETEYEKVFEELAELQ